MVSIELTTKGASDIAGPAWRLAAVAPFVFWLVLTATGLWLRPPTAPIELEMLASAWHMFLGGGFVPTETGWPAAHVPPLIPWLTALAWSIAGVSDLWPRMAASICGLAGIITIGRTANLLWPHRSATPIFSRLLLCGLGGFAVSLTMIEPEMFALPFTLLVYHGLAQIWLARPTGADRARWRLVILSAAILAALSAGWVWALLPIMVGWLMAILDQANAPADQRLWFAETTGLGLAALVAISLWLIAAAAVSGAPLPAFYELGNGWLRGATEASRREPWTLLLLPIALYPWLFWKTLWQALARHMRETVGTGFKLSVAALIATGFAGFASGCGLQGMLPIVPILSLLGARLLATQAIRSKDFHAVVPGFIALLLGLMFFLMNIIPTAHLDALWRQLFDVPLPIWMGGMGLASGMALLAIAYALSQMSPNLQIARTLQVACFPVLLMISLNLEFATNLRPFFDLRPVAERLKAIQDAGRNVAVYGPYRGEFDFVGRLEAVPAALADREAAYVWAKQNPGGAILTYFDGSPIRLPALPIYRGVARDRFVAIWSAGTVTSASSPIFDQQF